MSKCLTALEKQLSLLTNGEYDEYYIDCKKRHDSIEDGDSDRQKFHNLPYWMQMQDIFWHILDLREGKYHKSGNPRYEGRRGIPKIETIGERLYADCLDLIWRMDNDPGYMTKKR